MAMVLIADFVLAMVLKAGVLALLITMRIENCWYRNPSNQNTTSLVNLMQNNNHTVAVTNNCNSKMSHDHVVRPRG